MKFFRKLADRARRKRDSEETAPVIEWLGEPRLMSVSATVSDDTTTERGSGQTPDYATVRLTRTGSTDSSLVVYFTVNEEEAVTVDTDKTTGEYYMPATFEIGQSTIFVDINAIDDAELEPDDAWTFELIDDPISNDGNTYTVDQENRTASGDIKDNDVTWVRVGAKESHTVGEADTVTIEAQDYDGNAVPNVDYSIYYSERSSLEAYEAAIETTDGSGRVEFDTYGMVYGTGIFGFRAWANGYGNEPRGADTLVELTQWEPASLAGRTR